MFGKDLTVKLVQGLIVGAIGLVGKLVADGIESIVCSANGVADIPELANKIVDKKKETKTEESETTESEAVEA